MVQPLFVTETSKNGFPNLTPDDSDITTFSRAAKNIKQRKLINISFYADSSDNIMGKKSCFSRIDSFSGWERENFNCNPNAPEVRGFAGMEPLAFFNPTQEEGQTFSEWTHASWLPDQLSLKTVERAAIDYRLAVMALNDREVTVIFWTYSQKALVVLLHILGIGMNKKCWPNCEMFSSNDVMIITFKSPTMEEMMSLANRYSPTMNKQNRTDEILESYIENINDIMGKTMMRTATMWIARNGVIRIANALFPLPSFMFHFYGPWLQTIYSKGLFDEELDPEHILDQFLLVDGQCKEQIPDFESVLKNMDNPAGEVSTLDWRIKAAAKIWKARTDSVDGMADYINRIIRTPPPTIQPLASRGSISRFHGRIPEPPPCSFSQFACLKVNQPLPVGLSGYLAGAPVPDSLDAVREEREITLPLSPLSILATPFRQSNEIRWAQNDARAVFFHTSSSSSYTIILNQVFRVYDQLERARPVVGDNSISVSIVPSYTFLMATEQGARSPVLNWNWEKMWNLVSLVQKSMGQYPTKEDWQLEQLNEMAAYFAKALQISWDARIRPSQFRGMEISRIFDEQWKVWTPTFPKKLPLFSSVKLDMKFNPKSTKAPSWQSWPTRSGTNKWLTEEAPIGDLLPVIFTPANMTDRANDKVKNKVTHLLTTPTNYDQQPPLFIDPKWENVYPVDQDWDLNRGRVQELRANEV